VQNADHGFAGAVSPERVASRQKLITNHAEREDIAQRIGHKTRSEFFRSRVAADIIALAAAKADHAELVDCRRAVTIERDRRGPQAQVREATTMDRPNTVHHLAHGQQFLKECKLLLAANRGGQVMVTQMLDGGKR
jgi:hypothetical protein